MESKLEFKVEKIIKENIIFSISVLSAFAGVIVYAESRFSEVEKTGRSELSISIARVDEKIFQEKQDRREDVREVNQKLDKIIFILTKARR